jgi:hypothetical protein
MATPVFWLVIVLTIVICLAPAYVFKYYAIHVMARPDVGELFRSLYLSGALKEGESFVKEAVAPSEKDKATKIDASSAAKARLRAAVHAVHGTTYMHSKAKGPHTGYAFSQERGNFLFPLSARENGRAVGTQGNRSLSPSQVPIQPSQNVDVGRPNSP